VGKTLVPDSTVVNCIGDMVAGDMFGYNKGKVEALHMPKLA